MPRARFHPGNLPPWEGAPFKGLRVGDRVRFLQYAGLGRDGPEYTPATGTVQLVNVDSAVVTLPGDRRGARPAQVTEKNFLAVVGVKRNPGGAADRDTLEEIVDRLSLSHVLGLLGDICELKAEHIQANWQDAATARVWERAGSKVARLVNQVDV